MERVLVTGSNGIVGNKLIEDLGSNYELVGLDISKESKTNIDYIQCDITNILEVNSKLKSLDVDFVIHCAAIAHNYGEYSEEDFYNVNYEGTKNIVDFFNLRPNVKFIFLSTIAVYGEYGFADIVSEDTKLNPIGPYASSKVEAENYIVKKSLFNYIILRLAPIYSKFNFIDIQKRVLLKEIKNATVLFKIGKAKQQYSFLHIDNVVKTLEFNIQNEKIVTRNTINVCDSKNYSQQDLLDFFRQYFISKKVITINVSGTLLKAALRFFGIVFSTKKEKLESIYWKLAKDNIYSTDRLKELGIPLSKSLWNCSDKF